MNRTAEVKRLFLAGKNIDEICEELELNDREKRHQAAAIIRKTKQGLNIGYQRPGVGDRGEEITRLRLSGKSINEISKLTGLYAGQIEYYFRCNNIKMPRKLPKPKELSPRIEKQRKDDACVRELLAQGKDVKEIVEEVGVSKNFVYRRARELGIKFTKRESHNDIAELRRQGKTIFEIREITGKDAKTISHKCKKIGLRVTEEEIEEIRQRDIKRKTHDEDYVRNYVHEKSEGRFEYVSGYINMDSPATFRCTNCGKEQTREFSRLRQKGKMCCLYCRYGVEHRVTEEEKAARQEKKRLDREKKEYERERTRLINASRGEQIGFSVCQCGKLIIGKRIRCEDCVRRAENKRHELKRQRRIKNAKVIDKDITIEGLYRRDNGVCHICGEICNWDDKVIKNSVVVCGNNYPSIDHVMPLAKGGVHSWDNVKLAHRICNSLKGDSYDEIEMEKSNNQSHDECRNISRFLR